MVNSKPERIKINWKPLEPGLNLNAPSLTAGHYSTGSPKYGWVLYSRGGQFGCWNQRTEREFPPETGMKPVWIDGEWYWEKVVYATLPMVECPHCHEEQQWDDYYDIQHGDSRECHHCGKTIYVLSVDTQIVVRLGTIPED